MHSKGLFLPDELIKFYNNYWENNQDKIKHHEVLGNVFNIKRMRLDNNTVPEILETQFILSEFAQIHFNNQGISNKIVPNDGYYILEYAKDSFARMHMDGLTGNGATTIALLDKSEDLSGGYILVRKEESPDIKSFDVVEQDIGEVVIYNTNVFHGVSKVNNGTRRVLVAWFNGKD